MEKLKILETNVDRANMASAKEFCVKKIENDQKNFVVTANSEIIYRASKDKALSDLINSADLIVPDGIGVVLASKIIGKPLTQRVTGIDLMMDLMDYAEKTGKSVYLLGGKRGVADAAAEALKAKFPDIKIAGSYHGYYKGIQNGNEGHKEELEVISIINKEKPDMLFVALGFPAQEKFIYKYKDEISARLFIGVGGSFDVISGNVKRAPDFYQKHGLEWLYRLIKEPSRLKRSAALPKFALKVLLRRGK